MCSLRISYLIPFGLGYKVRVGVGVNILMCECVSASSCMPVCVCSIPLIEETKSLVKPKMLEDFSL